MAAAPAVSKEMPVLSQTGGPTLQTVAPAFLKIWNRVRITSPFPVTKPFLKCRDRSLRLTSTPIWRPFHRFGSRFKSRHCRQTPQNAPGGRSGLSGAGKHVQSSGLQCICCILSPRRAPEARAQNRLAGLAGLAGWAGLQSAGCGVPEWMNE